MNDDLNVWELLALAQQASAVGDQRRASKLAHQVMIRLDALEVTVQPPQRRGEPLTEWVEHIRGLPDRPGKKRPPIPAADLAAARHVASVLAAKKTTLDERAYLPPWRPRETTPPRLQFLITAGPDGMTMNGYVPDSRVVGDEIYEVLTGWFRAQTDLFGFTQDSALPSADRWPLVLDGVEALLFPEPAWEDHAAKYLAFMVTAPGVMARALVLRRPLLRIHVKVLGANARLAEKFTQRFGTWLAQLLTE